MLKRTLLLITCCISLSACGETAKLDQVKKQSLQDFIFVKGGTFTMGDFGTTINGRKLYYTRFGL